MNSSLATQSKFDRKIAHQALQISGFAPRRRTQIGRLIDSDRAGPAKPLPPTRDKATQDGIRVDTRINTSMAKIGAIWHVEGDVLFPKMDTMHGGGSHLVSRLKVSAKPR
jgi:hypothetical protein